MVGGAPSVNYCIGRHIARAVAEFPPTTCVAAVWPDFEAHVREYARRHLTGLPGYFVLSGLEHLSEPDARRFVERVSRMLGEPMPQDCEGGLVRDVIDRGARLEATSTVRYSDTRQGGNLHTDGCHRPGHVPDLFTLYCVRQARSGGALVLVHVGDILNELRDRPWVLNALRLPVHFDTRDDRSSGNPRTVQRPVLETTGTAARIYYLREYIDSAQRYAGVPPPSGEQSEALNVLDGLLDREDLQTRRRLRPGEMIVVDNRSVIHGRTAFPAEIGPGGRLLLRVWIAAAGDLFGESGSLRAGNEPGHDDAAGARP